MPPSVRVEFISRAWTSVGFHAGRFRLRFRRQACSRSGAGNAGQKVYQDPPDCSAHQGKDA